MKMPIIEKNISMALDIIAKNVYHNHIHSCAYDICEKNCLITLCNGKKINIRKKTIEKYSKF